MSNDLSPTATKEQNELLMSALTLARSDKASDQAKLLKWLESGPFLDKLDAEVEVRRDRERDGADEEEVAGALIGEARPGLCPFVKQRFVSFPRSGQDPT